MNQLMSDYLEATKLYFLNRGKSWDISLKKIDFIEKNLKIKNGNSENKRAVHLGCFFNILKSSIVSEMHSTCLSTGEKESKILLENLENFQDLFGDNNGYFHIFRFPHRFCDPKISNIFIYNWELV